MGVVGEGDIPSCGWIIAKDPAEKRGWGSGAHRGFLKQVSPWVGQKGGTCDPEATNQIFALGEGVRTEVALGSPTQVRQPDPEEV